MSGTAHIASAPKVAAEEQRSFEKNDLTLTQFVSLDAMSTLESQPRCRIWGGGERKKSLLEDHWSLVFVGAERLAQASHLDY